MSQTVNVKFAKCFIIFMAIVILVQGIVYLGMSVWGIILHNCGGNNSDPVTYPFEFVLDLIYFSSKSCGAPTIHVDELGQDYTLQIDYAIAEVITNREFIFLICYVVISTLWIVLSLLLLVTICGPITKTIRAICFWPWLLSVIGGSILDTVATGYHIHDIVHTTSAESTLEYIGVQDNNVVMEYLQKYDIYFITPGVVFTCISSRVVLIWLLNIFGSVFCMSLATVLSTNSSTKKKEQQHRLPVDTTIPTQPQRQLPSSEEEEIREIQQQDTIVLRYQPTAPPPDLVRKDRRSLEPLKLPPEPHTPPPSIIIAPVAQSMSRQQSTTNNKRVNELRNQTNIITPTPSYQSSDSHPENLDYPTSNRSNSASSQPTIRSPTPDLSPISPLNLRYSTAEGHPFPTQPHITQELRGQLPWSYTNIMNDPIAQKRIQSHLQPDDDEEFPNIPAPDYTIHPSRNNRQSGTGQPQSTNYSRW